MFLQPPPPYTHNVPPGPLHSQRSPRPPGVPYHIEHGSKRTSNVVERNTKKLECQVVENDHPDKHNGQRQDLEVRKRALMAVYTITHTHPHNHRPIDLYIASSHPPTQYTTTLVQSPLPYPPLSPSLSLSLSLPTHTHSHTHCKGCGELELCRCKVVYIRIFVS